MRTYLQSMLAALVLAALVNVTPNPVVVAPHDSVAVEVDTGAGSFVHGAGFGAEDKTIAEAKGWLGPGQHTGTVSVRGLVPGRTRLIVEYIVGMGVWRQAVADIVVEAPCDPPTVALNTQSARVVQGSSLMLVAMTTGTDVHVEWYRDTAFAGRGPTFLARDLPLGTHRYTARAANWCGAAVSGEAVIEVVPPRRRPVRR